MFKLLLLISIISVSAGVGFVGGVRWDKAERYDEEVSRLAEFKTEATEAFTSLSEGWKKQARDAQDYVLARNLQHSADVKILDKLLIGQSLIRSQFDDIDNKIYITSDLGTCSLSPDAVRLLRESSQAANSEE